MVEPKEEPIGERVDEAFDGPMNNQQAPPGSVSRRRFLKAAGLGLGTLVGTGLACGKTGQEAGPAVPPTDTIESTTVAVVTSPPQAPTVTAALEGSADLVLTNGQIITVDASDSIAQAVAVKNGYIQAVGSDLDIQALAGPSTQTIDLAGRALTPGLVDSHNHLQVMGQMGEFYVPFLPPEVRTVEELKAALQEALAKLPEGEWLQGYFLVLSEGRLPDKHDLDPVSARHPVFVVQQGGHYGSANSMALQMAGITADTPDPVGGVIAREANGEPSGVFYNHRAMDMLRKVAPRFTMEDLRGYVADTLPLFAACGVTSYQDNNCRGIDTVATYLDVAAQPETHLRGSIYYTLEWPHDLDRALKEIDYSAGGEFARFSGFKFLLDGQMKMAYCHEPHTGERWDTPTWDPKNFKKAVRELHDTGLQICVHCAGDAAADLTLDAYEEAMEANPRSDPRHRIEHAILTTPEATQRMKDLGVVVSTQPQFIRLGGDTYAPLFGEERARRVIVTREWLDRGVPLALGSDAPTTPWYTPQITLFGAVARVTLSDQIFLPEQALTIQEALRAHTMGSAYAAHEEDIKGSVEVGKLADLLVWNQDPYTTPNRELWKTPIDLTMVGGEIVYERA